jgi:hypothetical protein
MLETALAYAEFGWAVLPLHRVEDGRCSCGNSKCKSPGKHPRTRHGVKDASKDPAVIGAWFAKWPNMNIGIATGSKSHLIVVDIDGQKSEAKLAALAERGFTLPPTAQAKTGRVGGFHDYFTLPLNTAVPSRKDDGLEIKADGSYVVGVGSWHHGGTQYKWTAYNVAIAAAPDWLIDYARDGFERIAAPPTRRAKPVSAALAEIYGPPAWSEAEEARLRSALEFIPAIDREIWLHVGMAAHSTKWERAFQIFDDWSRTAPEQYDEAEQHKTWKSFDRPRAGARISIATIFHMARERGWNDRTEKTDRELTQRDKLLLVGLSAEFWHDKDHNAFATVKVEQHKENYSIKSTAFRNWLTRGYGDRYPLKIGDTVCPSAPSTQALTEAIDALHAKAMSGPEYTPAIRIAKHNGLIHIDLGQPQWNAVEMSSDGWRIVPVPPTRFIRPRGLRPLVTPVAGGCLSELREFVNVGNDEDFVLVIGWLIAALRPTGPYPVLIINGEHGAGKSICCRVIRRLIDPNAAELRSEPRDERDLLLAAKNGWVVALDNLSYVKNDLSDGVCRIATKGAFATRALYTDDEEFLLEVCRPVLLNGIPPLASRADLTDRAVVIVLPNMDDTKRRTEEEFWTGFEIAAPRIFGALLDGLSGAIRCLPSTELQRSTRMMDFAKWAEAGCRGLGATPGTFEDAYAANRSSANEDALDADSVAGAVLRLMMKKGQFSGTATELLTALETYSPSNRQDRRWPKDATRLSGQLRRVAPLLRPRGIEIDFDQRSPDAARNRLIEIKSLGGK